MKKIKRMELSRIIDQLNQEHENLQFSLRTISGMDMVDKVKELEVSWYTIGSVGLEGLERFEMSIHMAKKDIEDFNKKYRGYIIEY